MFDGKRGSLVVVLAVALCVPPAATSLGAATAETAPESRSEPPDSHAFSVDWPAGWSVVASDSDDGSPSMPA